MGRKLKQTSLFGFEETEQKKMPWQIRAIRHVAKRNPPKEIWDHIAAAMGEDKVDVDWLRTCYEHWIKRGYSPVDYRWATEWYPRDNIPGTDVRRAKKLPPVPDVPGFTQEQVRFWREAANAGDATLAIQVKKARVAGISDADLRALTGVDNLP